MIWLINSPGGVHTIYSPPPPPACFVRSLCTIDQNSCLISLCAHCKIIYPSCVQACCLGRFLLHEPFWSVSFNAKCDLTVLVWSAIQRTRWFFLLNATGCLSLPLPLLLQLSVLSCLHLLIPVGRGEHLSCPAGLWVWYYLLIQIQLKSSWGRRESHKVCVLNRVFAERREAGTRGIPVYVRREAIVVCTRYYGGWFNTEQKMLNFLG